MTKYDYLTSLKHYLHSLPVRERNAAIKYYDKYFTDAGPENEQNVISYLGSPKSLADKIINNDKNSISGIISETRKNIKNAYGKMNESQKKKARLFIVIFSPVWIGIILLFLFLLAFFAVCVFGALAFLTISGITLLCMSFPYVFNLTSVGLLLMGISLICIGIPVLVFRPAVNFVFFVIKKSSAKFISLFNDLISGKAKVTK